jgi:hypothetical protein
VELHSECGRKRGSAEESRAIAGSPLPQKLLGEEASDASATRRRPEGRATHLARLEGRREEPTEVAT